MSWPVVSVNFRPLFAKNGVVVHYGATHRCRGEIELSMRTTPCGFKCVMMQAVQPLVGGAHQTSWETAAAKRGDCKISISFYIIFISIYLLIL